MIEGRGYDQHTTPSPSQPHTLITKSLHYMGEHRNREQGTENREAGPTQHKQEYGESQAKQEREWASWREDG
jgi:hypothetical protein